MLVISGIFPFRHEPFPSLSPLSPENLPTTTPGSDPPPNPGSCDFIAVDTSHVPRERLKPPLRRLPFCLLKTLLFSLLLLLSSRPKNTAAPVRFDAGSSPRRSFFLPSSRLCARCVLPVTYCSSSLFIVHGTFFSINNKQVQEQLRHLFEVDPPFVKRNIEDLINKDYLHRLEGREPGKDGYKYVA